MGISENSMNKMKDVFWSERMKIFFEQGMRLAPSQLRSFASGKILRAIEDNAHERGSFEVAETDLVKAFLENTPVFYQDDMLRMLKDLGINAKEMLPNAKKNDTLKIENDIKKAADIAGVTYNESVVRNILEAYNKCFSNVQSCITLATTTKKVERRDLSVKYVDLYNLNNPYKIALDSKILIEQNHPIYHVFDEFSDKCPVMGYGMQFGVTKGLDKIWIHFASHLPQPIQKLSTLQNVPVSFGSSQEFLEKFSVNLVTFLGIEYETKTIQLHFRTAQMKQLSVEVINSMLEELEFVLPKKELVELCMGASTMYCTYNWESNRIQKLGFSVCATSREEVPKNLNLSIERFVNQVPFATAARKYIYSITFSKRGQYLQIESDYSGKTVDGFKGTGTLRS